jgi:plastocyanin
MSGSLPKQCRSSLVRCAAHSTCGRSGFVSCCRTTATGVTKCSLRHASKCTPPKGGAACVGLVPSCCDACGPDSCPLLTTTTVPGSPSTTMPVGPQSHTVRVGQDGLTFSPANVTIHVGDTVHWVWSTSGHSVVSGTNGVADGRFCSPADMHCDTPPLSNTGTTYDHIFTAAGTFPYYCSVHFSFGMTGMVKVQ